MSIGEINGVQLSIGQIGRGSRCRAGQIVKTVMYIRL